MQYPGSGIGNIDNKTDAGGIYDYFGTKPHAVSAIGNPLNIPFNDQTITYTPFNRANNITESSYSLQFKYGPDYERKKSTLTNNTPTGGGGPTTTRIVIYSGDYEKITTVNGTFEVYYVNSPNGLVAMNVRNNGTDAMKYVYTDHLGSIDLVCNQDKSKAFEQSFDAWGRDRDPANWANPNPTAAPDWLIRGYTGHEHHKEFGLINMNGRMYDPVVGRMLSPDNIVSLPSFSQSYNRYSYVLNNPLKYTDPTGWWQEGDPGNNPNNGFGNHSDYQSIMAGYYSPWGHGNDNGYGTFNRMYGLMQIYSDQLRQAQKAQDIVDIINGADFSDNNQGYYEPLAGEQMGAAHWDNDVNAWVGGEATVGLHWVGGETTVYSSANEGRGYPGQVNYNGYNVSSEELQGKLLQFSQQIGQPIDVTSGDRSADRNKAAGGANASRHLFGDAADIKVNGINNNQLSMLANQSDLFNTVIYYPDINASGALGPHVHLDLNPNHNNLFLIYSPLIIDGTVTQNQYLPFPHK